jgi:ubiquitin-hydrolase Zn-finger-containing protein
MSCAQVGCCDSSENKHATAHFHDTGHPIIGSLERGENWCYVDQTVIDER